MEKYFVNYDQALALKELGFDMPCIKYRYYNYNGVEHNIIGIAIDRTAGCMRGNKSLLFPLKSQVFDWFRKEYGYVHNIFPADLALHEAGKTDYAGGLYLNNPVEIVPVNKSNFHEVVESDCIDKLIEIAQNKNVK